MSINLSTFPSFLKLADVTPDIFQITRYQLVKFLLNLLKIFENILHEQIAPYLQHFFLNMRLASERDLIQRTVY